MSAGLWVQKNQTEINSDHPVSVKNPDNIVSVVSKHQLKRSGCLSQKRAGASENTEIPSAVFFSSWAQQ